VPTRRPIDARFAAAVTRLARRDLPYAEIVRRLQPLTREVGLPVPSYSTVRRIAAAERRRRAGTHPELERALSELVAGQMPRAYRSS
jgi:hypothetical protein